MILVQYTEGVFNTQWFQQLQLNDIPRFLRLYGVYDMAMTVTYYLGGLLWLSLAFNFTHFVLM